MNFSETWINRRPVGNEPGGDAKLPVIKSIEELREIANNSKMPGLWTRGL